MDERYDHNDTSIDTDTEEALIECRNVSASWGYTVEQDVDSGSFEVTYEPIINIKNITFTARKGELIAVCGPVGCGKTSMLTMIMNELEVVEGSCKTRGKVCYVEQEPFIISDSIKENIIFGLPYEDRKFKRTLQV